MTIEEFIEQMNKDSKFKWVAIKVLSKDELMGLCYELSCKDNIGNTYYYTLAFEVLEAITYRQLFYNFEEQTKERQMKYLYRKFEKLTPSMQKAIVDIMKTQNGEQIDDRENDI